MEYIHHPLSTAKPCATDTKLTCSLHQPMNSPIFLINVIQHVSPLRSSSTAWQCLDIFAISKNDSTVILMTSINSILSIFFNNKTAGVSVQVMVTNSYHTWNGFSTQKSHYNNNPYKNGKMGPIFDTFGGTQDAISRINLYCPVFDSRYVYMIYYSETKRRDMKTNIHNNNGVDIRLISWS